MPLIAPYTFPGIVTQELQAGNVYAGAAPDGVLDPIDVTPPYFGGRVNFIGQCTQAGLFGPSTPNQGFTLGSIWYVGAGTTQVTVDVRQTLYPAATPVAFNYRVFDTETIGMQDNIGGGGAITLDPANFVFHFRVAPMLLPSTHVVVTSVGALAADGRCTIMFGPGWGLPPFAAID